MSKNIYLYYILKTDNKNIFNYMQQKYIIIANNLKINNPSLIISHRNEISTNRSINLIFNIIIIVSNYLISKNIIIYIL